MRLSRWAARTGRCRLSLSASSSRALLAECPSTGPRGAPLPQASYYCTTQASRPLRDPRQGRDLAGGATPARVRSFGASGRLSRKARGPGSGASFGKSLPQTALEVDLNKTCWEAIQQTLTRAKRDGLLAGRDTAAEWAEPLPVEAVRLQRWHQSRETARKKSIKLSTRRRAATPPPPPEGTTPLSMTEAADAVLSFVAANQYSIIAGETGSGKTTQVPQILLDHAIDNGVGANVNIICTQPRRIAATSVAIRVASERGEHLGQTVGYHIRHKAELPKYGGSITYCTTGVLLKQLQSCPDDVMEGISHIILDEVHERDIAVDFVLILIKRTMIERVRARKPFPKLILMSATADTDVFSDYFRDDRLGSLAGDFPALQVPGRLFPVKRHYLQEILDTFRATYPREMVKLIEQSAHKYIQAEMSHFSGDDLEWDRKRNKQHACPPPELTSLLMGHIVRTTDSGAILVFLPGIGEMEDLKRMLIEVNPMGVRFGDSRRFKIFLLHSELEQDQLAVFKPVPRGVRKIILATNVAETSITIPEVTAVIDSGRVRQMKYNHDIRREELRTAFVSQSNLTQRAGRAGRIQAGNYYGLYHERRVQYAQRLPTPEMRSKDLADLGLAIKSRRNPVPIADFLADAVDPPSEKAVEAAVLDLVKLGALTEEENITPLGRVLTRLPLHPTLGKLVVFGIVFQCLEPMILFGVADGLGLFDLGKKFDTAVDAGAARFRFADGTFSEHLSLLHAYQQLRTAAVQDPGLDVGGWCRRRYIKPTAMWQLERGARQIEEILAEAGLIALDTVPQPHQRLYCRPFGPDYLNVNSQDEKLIRAVLTAGLNSNLAWRASKRDDFLRRFFSTESIRNLAHSVRLESARPRAPDGSAVNVQAALSQFALMVFDTAVYSDTTSKTCMKGATPITPLAAALFGHNPRITNQAERRYLRGIGMAAGHLILGRPVATPLSGDDSEETRKAGAPLCLWFRRSNNDAQNISGLRDPFLEFRAGLDRVLDRILEDLSRGRPVHQDPAWTLFLSTVVKLVDAEEFGALEGAMDLVERERKGLRGR